MNEIKLIANETQFEWNGEVWSVESFDDHYVQAYVDCGIPEELIEQSFDRGMVERMVKRDQAGTVY